MRKLAAIVLALIAAAALAEQPSRESVTQPLYVLRTDGDGWRMIRGIDRFDRTTATYSRLVPFDYSDLGSDGGRTGSPSLSATSDRIIFQSNDFMEFDVATGRLLRRYEATDLAARYWSFHGTVVTDEQARTLGIASGTYGFPSCDYSPPEPFVPGCAPLSLPDHTPLTGSTFSVLLRRSLDPADTTVTPVKVLGTPNFATAAMIAFDSPGRQFWLWRKTPPGEQWSTLHVANGSVGDPSPATLPVNGPDTYRLGLTFHAPSQSLFEVIENSHYEWMIEQLPTDGVTAASIVDKGSTFNPPQMYPDAVTAVPDPLPERYVQLIPAIGETPGRNDTLWRSDLWLYNPSSDPVDVKIRRVVKPDQTKTYSIAAHASLSIPDALKAFGGGASGDGTTLDALVIDAPYRWGSQLVASSRTYTSSPDGGTYGQSVPAVPSIVGYSNHLHDRHHTLLVPSDPTSSFVVDELNGHYRHNVGVVNDRDTPLEMRLSSVFGTRTIVTAPHSVSITNIDSLKSFFGVISVEADRSAAIWMSAVDNVSGDATFVPFSNFDLPGDTTAELVIPSVAVTAGIANTSWRTDLFRSRLLASETANPPIARIETSGGCIAEVPLRNDEASHNFPTISRDVASQFTACKPAGGISGALWLKTASWMTAYARTYTTRADGGTMGDMLPLYPQHGWPVQHFSGLEAGGRFRINAGLYNGQATTTTNRLLLYDANGVLVAQRDLDLAPHASLQLPLASLLNVASLPAGLYGLSVIPLGAGRSWAYVSLVDNISGDPTNLW